MWHNNHGNCGRDRDLALCYILWMGGREGGIIHTRHQGYAHNYYWTRVQAGHWTLEMVKNRHLVHNFTTNVKYVDYKLACIFYIFRLV